MQHFSLAWGRRCRRFAQHFLSRRWMIALLGFCIVAANAAELVTVNEKSPPEAGDQRLQAAIAAHQGRPVLINFWATWCEPCRAEMPSLQRLADRWRDRGLAVITVAVADNSRQVEDYLREIGVQLAVIHDPEQTINQPWGARVVPTTLILDTRHRIRLRGQGAIDWDAAAIDRQLQPVLNQPRKRHHASS